ncbi:MAG: polysaccharide pyruvyl transferase family protein [Deltaproteobacteria bacterium]|nr:polysaccharide pyruvyl transferase family protein [Deltaproteobacteria bacterium]
MGLGSILIERAAKRALETARGALDADRALQTAMGALIDARRAEHEKRPSPRWRSGEPLELLLAGYVGSRNTGADVRTEEMIRQFRHLLGDEHASLSILTIDPSWTRGYFKTVRQLEVPQLFPTFLYDQVRRYHGVIACEGSMFKSKFASALTTMMVGALGLARAEDKVAIGYGGEAGAMDASLEAMIEEYVEGSLIITRNPESSAVLERLGIETRVGTDTAWTFGSDEVDAPGGLSETLLRRAGWDGKKPVVVVCPIHPFWWPVKPDPWKALVHKATGAHEKTHFRSIYFHHDAPDVEKKLVGYLGKLAGGMVDLARSRDVFPVIVGMEALDRGACERFQQRVELTTHQTWPLFSSDEHDMFELVSILRRASLVVSSRYHALVCSMPAAVPSIGVTMDERIRNLMKDRGTPELSLEVDDGQLDAKIRDHGLALLDAIDAARGPIERSVARNLRSMGEMGAMFVDHVRAAHPRFPFRAGLGEGNDPLAHLPPLPALQRRILETHASESSPR